MLYRKVIDIVQPDAQPSGTAAQTRTFRIKQEARRLEAIVLRLGLTTAAGAITGAAFAGLAGVVKEIRVRVNDVLGSRNAVQVSGMGLLGYVSNVVGHLSRKTQVAYASAGFPTSTTIYIDFLIPLRHPQFAEPVGNQLSIPLSQRFLGEDLIVEVDLNDIAAAGAVFTTNPPSYASTNPLLLHTVLREVPETVPYIPSELRTDSYVPTSTASPAYEFPSSGFLTGFLIQGVSATALGNAVTRAGLLSTGGQYRLEYGRDLLARTDESFAVAINDYSRPVYPANAAAVITSATLPNRNFDGEVFFDFINDGIGTEDFAVGSIIDLNTQALGGDKFRIVWNDHASTSRAAFITYHKLKLNTPDQLAGLTLVGG